MPWYSSWIPTLPNFAIPTSIQGRFLSFILKKSLGHFVKPGQLDHHQIDSQIGSGYVQVNDLELHPEAINGYLEGLPVALHSGTVSSVKARIPWPNPLASTLGFSVKSIYLTFHVVSTSLHKDNEGPDLSSSVASVAESFVHEELSEGEEANLWKSLHEEVTLQSSLVDDQVLPGGLGTNSGQREFATKFETDPVGVSVFAGLIERLLARFEFDAQNIRITLIHPGNMALSLEVEEIKYLTNNALSNPADRGESRSLSLGGITISCRDLSSPGMDDSRDIISSHTPSPQASTEAAQFDMSQSILALPPRSPSPVDSVSSSMYESAISTNSSILRPPIVDSNNAPSSGHLPEGSGTLLRQASTLTDDSTDMNQRLLTFGPQPIVLRLTTPPPVPDVSDEDPFLHSEEPNDAATNELEISVSVGMLACLIRPWQIRNISKLATSLLTGSVHTGKDQAMDMPQIKIDARMRGAVAVLYSSVPDDKVPQRDVVADFFNKPLVPPSLEHGYTRIYLDNISVSFTTSGETQESMSRRDQKLQKSQSKSLDASIGDLSIFYFRKDLGFENNGNPPKLTPFPIVLTDPYLASQYSASHEHPRPEYNYSLLPTFSVIDWTDERCKGYGTKVSQWRCQLPKSGVSSNTTQATETNVLQPFLKVSVLRTSIIRGSEVIQISESMETNVAPLNIRADIQYLLEQGGPLSFFEDLLPLETPISDRDSFSSEDTVDMYSSTRNVLATKGAPMNPQFEDPKRNSSGKREKPTDTKVTRVVNLPFTRVAVRCPPPQSIDRSGTVILDVHNLVLSMNPVPSNKVVKFASDDAIPPRHMDALEDNIVCMVEFDRAVVACSMVNSTIAVAVASVGPLTDEAEYQRDENESRPDSPKYIAFNPRICVIKPSSKTSSKSPAFALSVDIPGVHVDISKQILDALQYWADDVSQLLEILSKSPSLDKNSNSRGDSRDTSLIGSRFFVNSRSGSGSLTPTESAESVIKLTVTEAFVRIMVPRSDSTQHPVRPFDLRAADLDVLIELNPDDKQQTVVTMGVMDLSMRNTDALGRVQKFFGISSPYSLSSTPKPIVKLRFTTSTIPAINSKETRIKLTLCNFTYSFFPDLHWTRDLATFGKNPPGTFESVIPSDRTRIFIKIIDGSIQALAPISPASIVSHINELEFSTDVIGDSRDSSFQVQATDLSLLVLDDVLTQESPVNTYRGRLLWTAAGYALLAEVASLDMKVINQLTTLPLWKVTIIHVILRLHLCADTMTAVTAFIQDFGTLFKSPAEVPSPQSPTRNPAVFNKKVVKEGNTLMSSVEDLAFKRIPEIGPAPDMIYDDLPSNMDYLDESFGAAAGLRELRDDDLEDFDNDELVDGTTLEDDPNVISKVGGETIKIFEPQGLEVVENYFHTIPPDRSQGTSYDAKPLFNLKVQEGNFTLFLYDGYDWAKTRKTIEEEVKEMRKRLAKIRQLVASGQTQDPVIEDTSALLFNSVHIGLDQDDDVLKEPSVLIAAIDEELKDDYDTATQSSWQSLRPTIPSKPKQRSARVYGKKLTRSKAPSMEFCLTGMHAEFDQYELDDPLVSRIFVTVRDLEILDHIKTSTWKKFLTELRSDSRGNVRETDSNMVRIELRNVRPVSGNSSEESRLRAKILPLRLYVDQDAVDFLKKFFSFKDPHSQPNPESAEGNEAYIQLAEIFPIDLKLDYKPRRVDYRALKEGRTIELMNFFHFDGAEMTLRHITLSGVTGWPKMFEMLNDLWTPDVKATQLAEVISGVAPIRSVVNVGSGVADLILLPIAQYKKDGRIVRGIQKGATAFVKSTAVEAIKMGAKLATGTQVILEQAEGILGGQFETITAEPVQISSPKDFDFDEENDEDGDLISKYAQQPADLKEGVQSAYKSLQKNLSSAAQTILAVPMEVYERSGNEGPVRSVIRAVPIAVLKPMIGASEAVSKTLLGLHNTLDPNVRHENDAKYKLR